MFNVNEYNAYGGKTTGRYLTVTSYNKPLVELNIKLKNTKLNRLYIFYISYFYQQKNNIDSPPEVTMHVNCYFYLLCLSSSHVLLDI